MAELLSDFTLWGGLLVGVAIGVVVSRILGRPWPVVLINVAGTVVFLAGLRWALALGDEAFLAASAASGGVVLWTIADRAHRRDRGRTSAATSSTAAG